MIKWDFKVEKPIFLILPGHSGHELKERWNEFKDFDCLWAGMNESTFLSRYMTEPLDILVYYCTHCNCTTYPHKHHLKESGARGNSLFEFILQCEENEVKDLVLFGADGYSDDGQPIFIYGNKGKPQHRNDCKYFNENLPRDLKLNIINVSPNSHYDLPKISYDEFLKRGQYETKW